MQELIPVNIIIGDRNYRIKIENKDEELVRKIIKQVNDKILEFKTRFAGKDMQDYISMVLLWYVTEQEAGKGSEQLYSDITEGLSKLEQTLDKALT
ncbi:MAG: cell division protein ZapA [Chitinophagaceae bacterium]|nr:cell division protein ZapA [Chitinophagaceae bacterium]